MPPRRRKRRVGVLSGDSLKNVGVVSGLIVTLWQGFTAGRKADGASQSAGQAVRASTVATAAVARDTTRRGRVDSLRRVVLALEGRVRVLERVRDRKPVQGPEPAPEGYTAPRGWLSRLLGNS